MEGIEFEETHPKTIIHIDIDYFYAQVEEIRDPTLKSKPLGIQQKNCLVTSNYLARDYGIKKLMSVTEAQKLCPNLVLVNGSDLINYKRMSSKIFDVLSTFTPNVEKLGLDENFMDVTSIIDERLDKFKEFDLKINGCLYSDDERMISSCQCGCEKRIIIGTHLADEIRSKLFTELQITSCAGIAHNKLLAKLVGSQNKPNKQTALPPICSTTFLASLGSLKNIPGIGQKTESNLNEIGLQTVQELQDCDLEILHKKFGYETACKLKDMCFGRDYSAVRPSGRPKTIGLEDSCKAISLKTDVEDKFRVLLMRLINQVMEDGRIPIAIKIILRKFDSIKKTSHRETKQCNILPSLFRQLKDGKILLAEGGHNKLLKIIMRLFERSVDMKQPFNITLLGLAFSKFQEQRKTGSCSIANFLIKKSDVEVQSITSLSNEGSSLSSRYEQRRFVCSSPCSMDYEQQSDASICSDFSESEVEPSPKKTRIGLLIAKRRCFSPSDPMDIASPSKLRVGDLRLNSRDSDRDSPVLGMASGILKSNDCSTSNSNNNMENISCPAGVDPNVFKELPVEVQNELLTSWRTPTTTNSSKSTLTNSTPGNTLHRYFITNK